MPLADLSWQSLRWLPMAVVAAGVAVAVTWWLYQPQLRLRSRVARVGLPLLRCVAMVALAVALLKPVVHREKTAAERGALLVLVDRSASMAVTDGSRSAAQLIALADGLKLLPANVVVRDLAAISPEDIEQIKAQADRIARAGSELDYARLADRGVEAAQTRLDESVAQMTTLAQSLSRPKEKQWQKINEVLALLIAPAAGKDREQWLRELRPNRIERVSAVAAATEGSAASKLYRDSPDVRAAADRVAKLSREGLARLALQQALPREAMKDTPVIVYSFASDLIAGEPAAAGATTQPADFGSDITGAVRAAVAKYPRDGVRAVVVLSDGRQVGGDGSVDALAAAIGNVPVYTVRVAAPTLPRDLSIPRVAVPSRAFAGETLNVRVDVRSVGIRGDIPVNLAFGETKQTKTLKFTDDQTMSAEFSVKLDKPGTAKLAISVAPQPGEISAGNNAIERWVNVLSDKVRVVAIAQSAGRDYQFLCDALERTAWVQLDSYIAPAPDSPAVVPADKLAAADLVVLEDPGMKLLPPAQWEQVRKLVTDRGGGAIVLAGESHSPAELLGQPDAALLLPFTKPDAVAWRNWAGEYPSLRPVPFRAEGDRSRLPDALRLTDDTDSSLKRWQELPPMYRLLAMSALKPNTVPLLIDAETKQPVMTESRLGGRVVFVGMTETWRWRYKIGQRDQDRFWLQLVRQVSDEPYAVTTSGGETISLDADRLLVEAGRSIRLRARVRDAAGKAIDAGSFDVTVKSSDGTTRTETLNVIGAGRYDRWVYWSPGEYVIAPIRRGEPADAPTTQPAPLTVKVVRTADAELQNLAGDDRLLRRLAEATGGQTYAPEQLSDLPAHLASQSVDRPQIAETRLWDSPYLFAFVLACLGLEWAVRKQAGLA